MAETGESGSNGGDPANQTDRIPPRQEDPTAPSEQQIAETDNRQAAENRKRFIYLPLRRFIRCLDRHSVAITAAATAAIAYLTFSLSVDSSRQADTTNKQFEIMKGQLQVMKVDERPWVSVKDIVVKKTGETVDTQIFDVEITLKNVGKSPAHDIVVDGTIINGNGDLWRPLQLKYCSDQFTFEKNKWPAQSFTIFPNDKLVAPRNDKKISERDANHIIGCVFYRWRADNDSNHQSGFVAHIEADGSITKIYAINPY